MRTLGMLGGLGPESTIDYYRSINARVRARRPDVGYPHIIINSLDVDKGIAMLDAGQLSELAGSPSEYSQSPLGCSASRSRHQSARPCGRWHAR